MLGGFIKRAVRGLNGATQFTLLVICIVCTFAVSPFFAVPAAFSAFVLGCYAMTPERR